MIGIWKCAWRGHNANHGGPREVLLEKYSPETPLGETLTRDATARAMDDERWNDKLVLGQSELGVRWDERDGVPQVLM